MSLSNNAMTEMNRELEERRERIHDFYRLKLENASPENFESAKRDLAVIETFLFEGWQACEPNELQKLIEESASFRG